MSDHAKKIVSTISNSLHLSHFLRVLETHDDKVVVAFRDDNRGRFVIHVTENAEDTEDCC